MVDENRSIVFNSGNNNDRRELPASRDRASPDLPLRDNPLNASPIAVTHSTPEDEALIGAYPYSGADIKLVVHLPPEDPRAGRRVEQEVQDELAQAISRLETARSIEEAFSESERMLADLRREEEELLALVPATEEGSSARTESEANVAEVRVNIEATLGSLRAAPSPGTILELDQQVSDLTDQLNALREGVPAPPTSRTRVLAEIQTLSLSSHREKYPVRTLGRVFLRSVTRGPRTVSGSVVFTTFHSHVMQEFLESAQYRSTGVGDWDRFAYSSALMDQIPPMDISISFANEYGNLSWMAILGVEFVNEGMVMSIEDLFLEGTAQYIARDFDPIRSVANRRMNASHGVGQTLNGSRIMAEDLRRRANMRNIPWI